MSGVGGLPGSPGRLRQAVVPGATDLPRLLAGRGTDMDSHFGLWGPMPGGGPSLIDEVERSGLRGRGGAGFPMAVKMRSVAGGRAPVVLANGAEREPVSHKDKVLMAKAPHLVLDGVSIAAETVGASEAVLCVDRSAREAVAGLARARSDRLRSGVDRVAIRIETSPGAYVTGEESALVHWVNGGPAKPTFVPPRPFQRGIRGRPTLVSNVETLAHLALIARFGAGWFRSVGTVEDPGSALVTISGDVSRRGVYEVEMGADLATTVGMAEPAATPQALLVGGYSGAWVPAAPPGALGYDSSSLGAVGASVGCSAVCVLGPDRCGLAETALVVRWMAGQSAGQCGPCIFGLPALSEAFDGLVRGDRRGSALRRVNQLLETIAGRGACHHPDGVVRLVSSTLRVFASDVDAHRRRGPCRVRPGALPAPSAAPVFR